MNTYMGLLTIFSRLPQDIYQVAKVSKILQLMEKGNADNYKNKSLDEIEVDMENIDMDGEETDEVPSSTLGI